MPNEMSNQSHLYREYYEIVKAFHAANIEYQNTTTKLTEKRHNAIQQAIRTRIEPVISKFQIILWVSVIFGTISMIMSCRSLYDLNSSSPDRIMSVIFLLIAIIIGFISFIVFSWSTSRIKTLYDVRESMEKSQPELPF